MREVEKEERSGISLRLRPHHICCMPFFTTDFSGERGEGFLQTRNEIKHVLNSEPDSLVMVIEGVDVQCDDCLHRKGDRCESPKGNEEKVRKWDSILLSELGISYGMVLKVREWQELIEEKTPFKICYKCGWKEVCTTGAQVV